MANFRLMTAMVLFRFEQELGKYISQRSTNLMEVAEFANALLEREAVKRPEFKVVTTEQLIAETYIEDLFQLMLKITEQKY